MRRWALWALLVMCVTLLASLALLGVWVLRPDAPGRDSFRAGVGAATSAPPLNFTPPPVEPVAYLNIRPDDARAINTQVPLATRPNPAATSYRLGADLTNTARAVDCLAAAGWYEAGDDAVGEAAVIQVVLNRLRHPSFPKSVCGVVFQGAERRTGCQFSFTCDGALRRIPSAVAWERARGLALGALSGRVFPAVGWSTHYHTDWVVPYWSRSVDKTAVVDTHLFFRWRGVAGEPSAFAGRYAGTEPIIAKLAGLSAAHRIADPLGAIVAAPKANIAPAAVANASTIPTLAAETLRGSTLLSRDPSSNRFTVAIRPDAFAGDLAVMAIGLCSEHAATTCTVIGQIGDADRSPDFYYFRDASRGVERVLWNCRRFPRSNLRQCVPDGFRPD